MPSGHGRHRCTLGHDECADVTDGPCWHDTAGHICEWCTDGFDIVVRPHTTTLFVRFAYVDATDALAGRIAAMQTKHCERWNLATSDLRWSAIPIRRPARTRT